MYLPDTAGIMAPAASLHFNDAPWLAEGSGLRLAHPDVPAAVAERLGARSLRYQHQVCRWMVASHVTTSPGFQPVSMYGSLELGGWCNSGDGAEWDLAAE